jgi:hypothetical protein
MPSPALGTQPANVPYAITVVMSNIKGFMEQLFTKDVPNPKKL